MSGRVTQQIINVVYKPVAEARVTCIAAEVLRTNAGGAPPAATSRPVIFLITSG